MQLSISILLFRGASWPVVMNMHIKHIHMHAYTNAESCHIYMKCRAYERVMSCMDYMSQTYDTPHIRISRVIHSKGWCNRWARVYVYEWAMSTYIICHIYQCGILNRYDAWRIWSSHVTYDRGWCTRWACIYDMSRVWMSHRTLMNASCPTNK